MRLSKSKNKKKSFWRSLTKYSPGLLLLMLVPSVAQAGFFDFTGTLIDLVIEMLFSIIISPIGHLMNMIMYLVVTVAMYNDFANEPIVITGWTIMRDVSNMFFVFILLIIALGTIVKWQVINYRQNLRRLIVVALLINFSRTIVVFFIDLSQVVMLTFLSAVSKALQAGFVEVLGIDRAVNAAGGTVSIITFIAAAFMTVVATIVAGVFLAIFVARIIALWVLIIFAPLAFILSTIPQTKTYYDKWWDMLGKNLAIGPILAFMLWLLFSITSQGGLAGGPTLAASTANLGGISGDVLVRYVIGIGFMLFSIKMASMAGAAGGSVAANFGNAAVGKVTGRMKRIGARMGYTARSAGVTAVTRPGDAAAAVKRQTAGRAVRLAARTSETFGGDKGKARGERMRTWASGKEAAYGEKTARRRQAFESSGGFFARQARRGARVVGGTEAARRQKDINEYAPEANRMSAAQRKDEFQSTFMDHKKAALAQAAIRNGDLDKLYSDKNENGEKKTKEQMKKDNKVADDMKRMGYEHSMMNPEDKQKMIDENFRYEIDKPEKPPKDVEDRVSEKLITGQSFSGKDMANPKFVRMMTRLASQKMSPAEFSKMMKKIPKQSNDAAIEGLNDRLGQLTVSHFDETKPEDRTRVKERMSERGKIRDQMQKFDPKNIERYSSKLVEVGGNVSYDWDQKEKSLKESKTLKEGESMTVEQYKHQIGAVSPGASQGATPFVDEAKDADANTKEYEQNLSNNSKKLKISQWADIPEDLLKRVGQYAPASVIIKADGHEDITEEQSSAMQQSVILNFDQTANNFEDIKATFNGIHKNPLLNDKFKVLIKKTELEIKNAIDKAGRDSSPESKLNDLKDKLGNVQASMAHLDDLKREEDKKSESKSGGRRTKASQEENDDTSESSE